MKIITLIENNPDIENRLCFEHGLSMLIEVEEKRILFDTGKSGDFIKNAKTLGCDLHNLDYLVISHGHYDHSGGIPTMLQKMDRIPSLVVGYNFFEPKYKKNGENEYKYNGNSFQESEISSHNIIIHKVNTTVEYLTDHIMIFSGFAKSNKFEKVDASFYLKENNLYSKDEFKDEIALGIITDKGLVVVVGCSHVGIVNILEAITVNMKMPIYAVIGGTHLIAADDDRIEETVKALKRLNIKMMAVSHCTGERGIQQIKEAFGDNFIMNNTGNIIEI